MASAEDWAERNAAFVGRFQAALGLQEDRRAGDDTHNALTGLLLRAGVTAPEPPAPAGLALNRGIRLPADQYMPTKQAKSLIVVHHTAGGSARSTFDWWKTTPERIGTAYIVERDGTVHEVFDPSSWAYHLGVKGEVELERRSIGIEIASEGGLTPGPGDLYAFGVVSDRTRFRGEVYDHGSDWRGFRHFAAYTEPALLSVFALVDLLCSRFGIPRQTPAAELEYDQALRGFRGVIGHHHVRADKSDVHPGFPWVRLVESAGLAQR